MSFALPSLKVKPSVPESFDINGGVFGTTDLMTSGLAASRCNVDLPHPVAASELKFRENAHQMNMTVLRNTQGLHAPLRLAMELKSAKRIGRLPFMPSSNVMHDALTGRDLDIGPEDIFNTPEFLEVSGQPHAVVERSLGLL
ncbi:proteasome maturation protein [Leptinotarsa decemlineata]|uniref:proteasome maturation protein n=1 Tax=Leptinotarsa decemlineata TaxID=7539 RepID=UPI000C253E8E|nr:proteasome maturation protein [Leptinotarsa decemlineata]